MTTIRENIVRKEGPTTLIITPAGHAAMRRRGLNYTPRTFCTYDRVHIDETGVMTWALDGTTYMIESWAD
jgi:hypothetical protein